MIRDAHEMDRRTVLRGAAGAAGLTSIGGLGILATNSVSGAHVAGSYEFNTPSALVNDTGDLDWVRVVAATDIQWTGFEEPVTHVGFTEVVEVRNQAGDTLAGPAVYWGQNVDDVTRPHPEALLTHVGNDSGPYELDGSRDDHDPGTTGSIQSGGVNYQVLIAEGGDGSAAEEEAAEDSAIDTVPLDADEVFEPDSDGATKTVIVHKTEFAHLYTTVDGSPDLLHPGNGYGWAPGAAEVTGSFEVTVENREASTDDSTGTTADASAG